MLVTIISHHRGRSQVQQIEAPTVKDCLVAWAGKFTFDGITDEARTRLRGNMADFDGANDSGFPHVWKLETDLGAGDDAKAAVFVVETVRR